MKLSLKWIFEHIDFNFDISNIDVKEIINLFNLHSAEIESIDFINLDLNNFYIVQIKNIDTNKIIAYNYELKKEVILPIRKDAQLNKLYLIKKISNNYNFVSLNDLSCSNLDNSDSNNLLTNIYCSDENITGNWKNDFECKDYIIEVNNATIAHRSDMWSHRGFARELAALLNKKLISEDRIFEEKSIKNYDNISHQAIKDSFIIEIIKNSSDNDCNNACRRYAGLNFEFIENKPSLIFIANRLAKINIKPINTIVDFTNYIMLDIGQPMHAYDANTIKTKKIITGCAKDNDRIRLIDQSEVILKSKDYIITDGQNPIAIAGVMGSIETAVKEDTSAIFLESANFEPNIIRNTANRIKKRTEASIRFEKNLDPNQNTQAILRYLKLLNFYNINYKANEPIISLGQLYKEKIIKINYNFILERLGINISQDKIKNILNKLEFGVELEINNNPESNKDNINFIITVPTFRAIKDINIKEDILEEIVRFIGYNQINPKLPQRLTCVSDIANIMTTREIKKHLAYGIKMTEIQNYPFFDDEFLIKLKYRPKDYLELADKSKKLVTSLVPNLLKAIYVNLDKVRNLNFFELNRVWFFEAGQPVEFMELSGIFYNNKEDIDFYKVKEYLNSLFDLLNIEVEWKKPKDFDNIEPWYNMSKTAELYYKNRIIGMAGNIDRLFLNNICYGDAFIFELDANFLTNIKIRDYRFKELEKYPESYEDISFLIDKSFTVDFITQVIKNVSNLIKTVKLIDVFYKEEWAKQHSLTFRINLYNPNKTLTKPELEKIVQDISKKLTELGAKIR